MKKTAFTLGEVLVTLGIIGALMLMIVPGVVKNVNNKINMSLLQKTISDVEAIAKADFANHGGDYKQTDMCKDSVKFLKKLDPVEVGEKLPNNSFNFKSQSGEDNNSGSPEFIEMGATLPTPSKFPSALLKTGVLISISTRGCEAGYSSTYGGWPNPSLGANGNPITIYLNGTDKDKISGVNYFTFYINVINVQEITEVLGGAQLHYVPAASAGDIDAITSNPGTLNDRTDCNACYRGMSDHCAAVVVASGFDPEYMKNVCGR